MKRYQRKYQGKKIKTYVVTVSTPTMDDEHYEVQADSMEDAMLAGWILTYHHGDLPSADPDNPREVIVDRKAAWKTVKVELKGKA